MSQLTSYAIETFVSLAAIMALAVLVLYAARRMGVGRPAGPLELVGRLPLDGRRVVYLVRVGRAVYVLGASEAGLRKLGELDANAVILEDGQLAPTPDFRSLLKRALARPEPPIPSNDAEPGSRKGPESDA